MDGNETLLRMIRHLAIYANPGSFWDVEVDIPRDDPAPDKIKSLRISFDVDWTEIRDMDGIAQALKALGLIAKPEKIGGLDTAVPSPHPHQIGDVKAFGLSWGSTPLRR